MADKIVEAEKNYPTYEISPKWIIIYQIVNFLIGFGAYYLCNKFDSNWPLFYYLLLQGLLAEIQIICYFNGRNCKLPSSFKHPGLLSSEELIELKESLNVAKYKLECYKFKGKAIPAKHQEKYDTAKSKYDEQCKLRSLCWFKYLFCDPKSTVSEDNDEESSEGVVESVNSSDSGVLSSNEDVNSDDSSDSDSSESDFDSSVTDYDDMDRFYINDKKSFDKKVVQDKKRKTTQLKPELQTSKFSTYKNYVFNVDENKAVDDREVEVAALTIKKEIKKSQTEASVKKPVTIKIVNAKNLKFKKEKEIDENENLRIQLAEIKAENVKLKNSFEKLFASQNIF